MSAKGNGSLLTSAMSNGLMKVFDAPHASSEEDDLPHAALSPSRFRTPADLTSEDPHGRAAYLPDHPSSSSFSSALLSYPRPLLLLVFLMVVAFFLVYSPFSSSSSSPLSSLLPLHDSGGGGGATSGKEVNLYRLRSSPSSYPLPSSSPSPTPFPPLSSLLLTRPAPGLSTLLSCASTANGRLAVMTSISPYPTAAEVGLALLTQPWCVVVIGDKKGPTHSAFTSPPSVARGIAAYTDLMARTHQTDAPAAASITPADVMARIAYIDVSEQTLLPYALSPLTPYSSFSRKNLGFLLAFHAHATAIFDVDDDNIYLPNTATTGNRDLPVDLAPLPYPSSASLDLAVDERVHLDTSATLPQPPSKAQLTRVNVSVFNPYPLYGATDAWPRGFPLNWVRPTLRPPGHYAGHCLASTRTCTAVVQQFLANQDPDVDAIYRLTNPQSVPFYFLAQGKAGVGAGVVMTKPGVAVAAPTVALPSHTFTPFNAQATVITPGAFFAMLLPFTVHGRVSDIWRSYVIETLLTYYTLDHSTTPPTKAIQHAHSTSPSSSPSSSSSSEPCVVFTPPRIYHDRNAHNYQQDFNSEMPLYTQAEALVGWLTVRVRGGVKDLLGGGDGGGGKGGGGRGAEGVMADAMWRLYVELYEAGVVEEAELPYVQAWLEDVSRMPVQQLPPPATAVQQHQNNGCFPSYFNPTA